MGTVTFSAKRSNPQSGVHSRCTVHIRYAVHSRSWCKKVNSHSGLSKYGWWGLLPLVQKGQTHTVGYAVGTQYAVGMQYAVDVGAKRSTHTVDLANIGGGVHYP